MSMFDEERKQMGLPLIGSSSSLSNGESIFANERARQNTNDFGTSSYSAEDSVTDQANNMISALDTADGAYSNQVKADNEARASYQQRADEQALSDEEQMAQAQQTYADMPKYEPSLLEKTKRTASAVNEGVGTFFDSAANAASFGLFNKLLEHNDQQERIDNQDSIIGTAGEFTGMALPIGAAYATGGKLAGKALTRLAPNAPKLAQNVVRGIGAGLAYGTADEAMQAATGEQQSVGGRLGDIGKEAALFGAGDAAFGLAGKGLQKVAEKYTGTRVGDFLGKFFERPSTAAPEVEQQVNEMLALPSPRVEARMAAAAERGNLARGENALVPAADIPANALPMGNYIKPTRLSVNPDDMLNSVMQRIKPEVEQAIAVPQRRDLLVGYIQKHTEIPREEIWNMPMKDLQELGQYVREGINVPEIAFSTARKYGYDLPSLLDRQVPSIGSRVTRDAQARTAGVYPESLPNVRQPEGFNTSVTGQAAAPVTVAGRLKGGLRQTPQREVIAPAPQVQPRVRLQATRSETPVVETPRATGEMRQAPRQPVDLRDPPRLRTSVGEPIRGGLREYGTLTSLKNSSKTNQETIERIGQKGDTAYTIKANQTTLNNANRKLERKGEDGSKSYLLNKDKKAVLSSDDLALGYRLIDQYQAKGDYDSAADVALKLMQSNLEGGRSIQINAIYNRLTPEGTLRVATREYNKGVSSLADQKPIPPQVAEQIKEAATKLREATGNTQLAKDAMSIFEKARSGESLTDAEISQLRKFANEAKKYVGDESITRKRDRIVEYTSKQADAARKRLAASRNIGLLPKINNPLADYVIIGIDHMAKGAVKFADFAENMTKEFGSKVDGSMDELYIDSWKKYQRLKNLKMSDFEKMVNQAISGEVIPKEQASVMRRMAIELSQLEGNAQREAMADLQLAFNSIREGTRGQKASSLLRSAQLGNIRTMLRNEVSNNLFYALDTVRRKFSVIPDIITPGDRTAFFKNNPNSWKQYFSDWKEGWKFGKQGINPKGLETQYDLGNLAFNPTSTKLTDRVGSFLERHVGALMKASDYASANRAISTELYQMAQAKAFKEGLRGKALREKAESYFYNADEKMQEEALKYGEYMTFQDRNFLSTAAVKLKEDVLNLGKDFGLGNIVFNYPKTPANILMRSFDYSPLGYLKFMTQVGKVAFKKDVTKKEMIDSFTRATAGTGMAAMGAYLAYIGLLNVLPSKDSAVNSLERSAGTIPNSLNISGLTRYVTSFGDREAANPRKGDVHASVDWLQPMAITGSVGASFAQAQSSSRLKKSVGAADALVQSLDAAAESAGNMSVYKNIKDLVGSQYQGAGEKTGRLLSNAATAGIPSLLGQLRNSIDPNVRDTKDENITKQIGKSVVNKLPGASKLLPERYDTFGKEMKSDYGPMGRVFNSFINPSIVDEYNPSEGAKVVLDLINRTGETRLAPNFPSKTFTYKKETYRFTPEEYRQFQQEVGGLVEEGLNKNLTYLQNSSVRDDLKMKRMDDIMRNALEKSKIGYRKLKGIR